MTGTNESCSQVHKFLDHSFDTTAFGRMPNGALFAQQTHQADPAQDVVAVGAEAHDEIVGGKFAGRQALDVQR